MSRVVALGAGGMLGHKVCQQLRGHEVIGLVRRDPAGYERFPEVFDGVTLVGGVDAAEGERLERTLRELDPDFVVNCVGLVKQLDAAADPYLAVAINALLPHRLTRLCAAIGARLIHISTDCVFDGRRGSYRETDPADATDLYGRSKALGETVAGEGAAVTLRTSFVGRELKASTHGLVEWFLAQDGGAVDGFARVIYSGLTSLELAAVIRRVIERGEALSGTYHVAGEPISKYDLLMLVREVYGLDVEVRRAEEPVSDRSLVMSAFREATGYSAPPWSELIRRMHADPTPYGAWRSEGEDES